MNRIIRTVGLLALGVFIGALAKAEGGPAQPLSWSSFYSGNPQFDTPIEQQTPGWLIPCADGTFNCHEDQSLWVVNPTLGDPNPCAWDADDHWTRSTIPGGYLEAGESITLEACYLIDWIWSPNRYPSPGFFTAITRAAKPGLQVTICTDAQTRSGTSCATAVPVKVGNEWRAQACVTFSAEDNVEDFPPVEGSNGGHASLASVTVSVTNVSGQRLRDVFAAVEAVDIGNAQPRRAAGECL